MVAKGFRLMLMFWRERRDKIYFRGSENLTGNAEYLVPILSPVLQKGELTQEVKLRGQGLTAWRGKQATFISQLPRALPEAAQLPSGAFILC